MVGFSVIIVASEDHEAVQETLTSLQHQQADIDCSVLTTDEVAGESQELRKFPSVKLIPSDGGDLRNRILNIVRNSRQQLIALVEAGARFEEGVFAEVAEAHAEDPTKLLFAQTNIISRDGGRQVRDDGEYGLSALLGKLPVTSSALFTPKTVLSKLGTFLPSRSDETLRAFLARAILSNVGAKRLEKAVVSIAAAAILDAGASPSAVRDGFRELKLTDDDARLLSAFADREANVDDLVPLLRHACSAKLNIAVAQTLIERGRTSSDVEAVFGGIDWSPAPTRIVCTPSQRDKAPLFTILIATFNAAEHLPSTLQSIADQNRDDIECIVIDGASRDSTLAIAAEWVHVVTNCFSQRDRGLYDALNKGLAVSRGTLIGIVGAGDCYLPGALDAVADAFYRERTDVYGGQTIERASDGSIRKRKDEPWGVNAFVSGGPIGHNAMFATRQAYREMGHFGRTYPMAEDTRWMHRAIHARRSFTYISRPITMFPLTGMSNSNPDMIWQEAHALIRQNFPSIDINRADALGLLYAARGWSAPESIASIISKYDHIPLNVSAAEALRALGIDENLSLTIFKGLKWDAVKDLYVKNGLRFVDAEDTAEPLISIVIPSHNVESYLSKTLNSVLTQEFDDLEIVIVDDGSTDSTLNIAKTFAALDGRVRVKSQANKGPGTTRLVGLSHARGRYVWFVDSDDFLQAGCLNRIARILRDEQPDTYRITNASIDERGVVDYSACTDPTISGMVYRPSRDEKLYGLLAGWSAQPWRFIIRREFIRDHDITFHVDHFYEDHIFGLKLIGRLETIYIDPSVSYMYLTRAGSVMSKRSRRAFDFIYVRRLCIDFLKSEGLFERMPAVSLSYVMPTMFINHVVAEEDVREFVDAVLADMDDQELALFLRTAGSDDIAAAKRGSNDFSNSISRRAHHFEQYVDLVEAADRQTLHSTAIAEPFHPLSRSLKNSQIFGLHDIEDGSSIPGAPRNFAWSKERLVILRLNLTNRIAPMLYIRFRNIINSQMIVVDTENFLRLYPCMSQNIADVHTISVPLDASLQHVVVKLSMALSQRMDIRDLGIIFESIDLFDGDIADHVPQSIPALEQAPLLVIGNDTRSSGSDVQVRCFQENRPYVIAGNRCDIAGTFVFERGVGSISIGDGTSIGSGCLLICTQAAGIHIGRNVMLSWDVLIMDSNAHSLDLDLRSNDAVDWLVGAKSNRLGVFKNWYDVTSEPVVIEDGVWIGFGTTIMKGVTIGEGSVIASKSVVTKSVPPYTVVGGNPARVLGSAQPYDVLAERASKQARRFPDVPIPNVTFTSPRALAEDDGFRG